MITKVAANIMQWILGSAGRGSGAWVDGVMGPTRAVARCEGEIQGGGGRRRHRSARNIVGCGIDPVAMCMENGDVLLRKYIHQV